MQVALLQSYEHMGIAGFTCQSCCMCKRSQFDGHNPTPVSLEVMHNVKVSQSRAEFPL